MKGGNAIRVPMGWHCRYGINTWLMLVVVFCEDGMRKRLLLGFFSRRL